uniref:Spermatogenesis-associated protein 13 n=1 Tax=Strigamia maritima TaxID=126957 RepID=T1IW01_STRMM
MDVVVITSGRMPTAMDDNLLTNRGKLLKLAENIKTRKKTTLKKTLNLKEDPSFTNIEHLVFGTYRSRASPAQNDCISRQVMNDTSKKYEEYKKRLENTVWYSPDGNNLLENGTENLPNGVSKPVADTNNAETDGIDVECEVGSSKQRPVISRSKQKPPVHLNANRSPPTRVALTPSPTSSHQMNHVFTNDEQLNRIVVKVEHLEDKSNVTSVCVTPKDQFAVPTDTSSSSLSNSNTVSESSDLCSDFIQGPTSPPTTAGIKSNSRKVEQKSDTIKLVNGRNQHKAPPTVATNRSAMLRQSRATSVSKGAGCSFTKSNLPISLPKNDKLSLKNSSYRGASLSGSRGGSLSGSRNSLSSSRGSLVNASAATKGTSKLQSSKSVNQKNRVDVSVPAARKLDKGPLTTQKFEQKTVAGKGVSRKSSTTAPALPVKTRANGNRRPSISRVQISAKTSESGASVSNSANNTGEKNPMAVGLTLAVVGKEMSNIEKTPISDSSPSYVSSPLSHAPVTKDIDDEVRYIKSLPSPLKSHMTNTSSDRNYSLERPNKPLYTWYDTRKRGLHFASSQDSSPTEQLNSLQEIGIPIVELSPFKANRLTTSLPKSFVSPKFSIARRRSDSTEKEEIFITDRRDTEAAISPGDKYDRLSKQSSISSIGEEPNQPITSPNGNDNQNGTPIQSPPPSPRLPKVNSPCGRPHGSTGCLRCSTGGQKLALELRLLHRDPSMPKCVRRIKASSSPSSFSMSPTDLSASESDLRRPWSQVYSEAEAQKVLELKSRALDSITLPNSTTSSCADLTIGHHTISPSSPPSATCKMLLPQMSMPSMFTSRCSSLRAPGVRNSGNTMESVLQKFRKSFSLRFQRHQRPTSPLSVHSGSTMTLPDGTASSQSSVNNQSDTAPQDDDESTVFRFGPIVWRSSKEKKKNKNKNKDAKYVGKCSSPDSGIHIEVLTNGNQVDTTNGHQNQTFSPSCAPSFPVQTLHKHKSPSLRLTCQKKSLTAAVSSSVSIESDEQSRKTHSDLGSSEMIQTVVDDYNLIMARTIQRKSNGKTCEQRNKLRRSVSQPMEMDKMSSALSLAHYQGGHSDHEDSTRGLCTHSDDEPSTDDESSSYRKKKHKHARLAWSECIMYAEALWDHVTMDPDELPFKAGDLVAVVNCIDQNWWWGALQDRMGWFPADFVRARVNQTGEPNSDCSDRLKDNSSIKNSVNQSKSNSQIRTNVIKEIVSTERDFVQHMKDVIEGYLKQVRKRPDMFPEERINAIFGNMEQIYNFQSGFLRKLEECIDWESPHQSCVGACFVNHRDGFQVYSEYCNNHPQALNELQQLFAIPKYSHFFEACRLLQEMIDISLDGFLLTPVQKICKYPLQLAELLKFTPDDHPDQPHVAEALQTMRQVAHYINERKRRMECLEKIASWQLLVEDWEGPDILDISSELIHSGDVTKVTSTWSRDLTLFLFDHQLIICKRDLLKRNTFCYKGRICMDQGEVIDLPDGRDTQSGLIIRHAWRMYCSEKAKWVTFCSKTCDEKSRWMKAFKDERNRVEDDEKQGFILSDRAKITAMVLARNKLKRSKSKRGKEFFPGRHVPRVNVLTHHNDPRALTGKTGSLPLGLVLSNAKKKNSSGWFAFGSSNKKQKR